jgi:Neuraminidase (sialidase)
VSIGPCEPSISINRFNDNQVIAGSVLDNLYRSEDGGRTWSIGKINSTHGVFGDPVLRRDKLGNPLYAHLSNSKHKPYASTEFLDRIVVQRSLDQGKNWTNGSYPLVDHQKDHDKHWLYTDPITGAILMSWTEFDVYGSKLPRDKSRILFSQSTDNGITWSNAVSISEFEGDCIDDDKTTEGAHPCVGIDGTYYVVWSFGEKLYLDISKDKGISWLSKDIVVSDQPQGWSYNIPGISRCNGMPVMACDHSDGPYKGRLFISWSDQRNGEHNTDIWIMSSDDKGKTWSKPLRVNNDITETHQFMSWMDIDHVTGNIYIVFYDRRNHKNNSTDVYMAYSQDGGRRFENVKINNKEFTPTESVFFGDYNDISAHNGKIRPIWTTYESGKLSVRTAIINVRK